MDSFTKDDEASLATLAEGAAIEIFNLELAETLKNIADINRIKKFKREIHLIAKLEPGDAAGVVTMTIESKLKLAARNVISTTLMWGKDPMSGRIEVRELAGQQRALPGFGDRNNPEREKDYDA